METDKLIAKKALDTLILCDRHYSVKSLGFLDPREQRLIEREIRGAVPPGVKYEFFGGYPEAERRMFICEPEYLEPDYEEIITVLEITHTGELSHRDFLGSLMGLGIKRENIGDIAPMEDRCLIFIKPAMYGYIKENLIKVGRRGVKISKRSLSEVNIPKKPTEPRASTVSSLRLDCIVSAGARISRGRAADLIRAEDVKLNFEICKSVSEPVEEGDILSIKGFGRFKLSQVGGTTRKGRISVIIDKYI